MIRRNRQIFRFTKRFGNESKAPAGAAFPQMDKVGIFGVYLVVAPGSLAVGERRGVFVPPRRIMKLTGTNGYMDSE